MELYCNIIFECCRSPNNEAVGWILLTGLKFDTYVLQHVCSASNSRSLLKGHVHGGNLSSNGFCTKLHVKLAKILNVQLCDSHPAFFTF